MNVDVSDLCCVNSRCRDYGKRGAGNLVCRKLYGRSRSRFLRCRSCGEEFSEHRGTALFDVRLPLDKAIQVYQHLADGCGIRQTARQVGVSKDTVLRLMRRGGGHAQALHDELVRHLKTREVQFDEKWSFVGKKGRPV
jgi:transposase-like protein